VRNLDEAFLCQAAIRLCYCVEMNAKFKRKLPDGWQMVAHGEDAFDCQGSQLLHNLPVCWDIA
jgi:hypothetical protein